jgi:hypothetical protein
MSDDQLTPAQEYQRDYYRRNKAKRTKDLSERWHNDPEFRNKERARNKRRRALNRAVPERAGRLQAMIEERRSEATPTWPPRFVVVGGRVKGDRIVGGKIYQVWSVGSLSREVGRTARAVRAWVSRGDIPGATCFTRDGRSWFSESFAEAVLDACEKLYFLDGRGDRKVLRRLIHEELDARQVAVASPN